MRSSRISGATGVAIGASIAPSTHNLSCDLCGGYVPMREVATRDGRILGLITCGQCVEDAIAARTLETTP